ncbi:MAG: hypothetical protein K8R54_11990 [Bacteroidales bacterium]|nr:hypothetical protein [Bacteroidales bacterium]
MKKLSLIKVTSFFLITLFFISFSGKQLVAQTDTYDKVVLEMQKDDKIKKVKIGKRVRIWYEGEKYTGYLDSITNETIFVDGQELEIEKIEKIGIKFKATQITGAVIGTSGLLITALGTFLIIEAQDTEGLDIAATLAKVIILTAFGVIIDAVGITSTTIGASIFFIGKKYKKSKGWNFTAVQLN